MSFLDSVLSSLQTGQPSQLPVSQPPAPPATSSTKQNDRSLGSAPRQPASNTNVNGGIKRKAEDQPSRPIRPEDPKSVKPPASRPLTTPGVTKTATKPAAAPSPKPVPPRPAYKNGSSGTAATAKKAAPVKAAPSKPALAPAPAKAPPKGSYADLMAQAKAKQEKAPSNLLTVRHRTVTKNPTSHRDLKRRMDEANNEAKLRARAEAQGKRFIPKPSTSARHFGHFGQKGSSERTSRKSSSEAPTYKGTAKPTQTPEPPAYRGTAGLPGKNGGNDRRQQGKRRMNEYMGTDEEDEGDYGGYEDAFYSDASSDMEAGFTDVEREEGSALKSARREDEEDLRQEQALKKEKMERQKKLAALASRKR